MKRQRERIKKRVSRIQVISVALTVLVIALLVMHCFSNVQRELTNHTHQSLMDVTRQNASAFQAEIASKRTLAVGMATGLPMDQEGIESNLRQVHTMRDLYNFKRMGYIKPDGTTFTSDGYWTNLGQWDFTKRGLHGQVGISSIMTDTVGLTKDEINVITVPVYEADGETVRGVFFTSYLTQTFRDMLLIDSYGGRGVTCALLPNGDIMVGSDRTKFQESDNVFDVIRSYGLTDEADIAAMEENLANGRSGFLRYTTDADKYMYYMPVEIMDGALDWYVATIVPTEVLDERVTIIQDNVQQMVYLILACVIICVLVCVVNYRNQHMAVLEMAYTDELTGGDNYTAFRTKMRQQQRPGYIVAVDLDEFKLINNTCGIEAGDKVIVEMGRVLREMLAPDELMGHINGDNFVLFLSSESEMVVAERVTQCAQRLQELSEQLRVPHIVPKFGIFRTDDSTVPEDGYGKANMAKKYIKDGQDAVYAIYNEALRQTRLQEQQMTDRFQSALESNQFETWYQPKVDPATGQMVGSEVLTRWRDLEGNLISPAVFIPLFERNGMILRLDQHIFRRACRKQRQWMEAGYAPVPVSVNISRATLFYPDVVDQYLAILREEGVQGCDVCLEVTESAMVENDEVEETIRRFADAGFCMVMDDFGSGYSSLSTLSMNCFSAIKLDKQLIDCIGDPSGDLLLRYTMELAHSLRLSITAEGVEEAAQAAFLKDLRCDNIQGYYYSKPLPLGEYEILLLHRMTLPRA